MNGEVSVNDRADVTIVLGTRPEIIKLAPVIRECERRSIDYNIVHTGQHYSESLNTVFFDQLELPPPEYNLEAGSDTHASQTARIVSRLEPVLRADEPDTVLVQGDTNSVFAAAIVASKLDVELGHIEAGLRSFDRSMPEETNRVLTDHTSEYLFAPTEQSREHLLAEGLPDQRIHVTGNTIVDSVEENRRIAGEKSTAIDDLGLSSSDYCLMTAHRAENVDDLSRFVDLLEGARRVAEVTGLEIIYPIHPRAVDAVEKFDITIPEVIRTIEPQDYLDFLQLETAAKLVLTDSGGVQEEACILGVPCVTMRQNTERPETIAVGSNQLAGTDPEAIVETAVAMLDRPTNWPNPFGDGTAAEQILNVIEPKERRAEVI